MGISIGYAECLKETEKAILVRVGENPNFEGFDGSFELWVPQSQVDEDSEVWQEGDAGVLVLSEWFAQKEGLT